MLKRISACYTSSRSVPLAPTTVEPAGASITLPGLSVPTYPLAGTHRLHHIPNLCPACKQIDTRIIAVAERYTLLANFWDLEGSAIECRFCALLAQAIKDNANLGLETTPIALGFTRKDACSLCLALEAGILRVYLASRPSKITDDGFTLAEFRVYLDEDAGFRNEISGEVASILLVLEDCVNKLRAH